MKPVILRTRIEKAALDNGFDLPEGEFNEWLKFRSSHCPLTVWMRCMADGSYILSLSDAFVAKSISHQVNPPSIDLPSNAVESVPASDLTVLYALLRRAFQLSRALPSEPLKEFQKKTQGLPRSTDIERIVVQRVGQDIFRERLLDYWDSRCAVTGLAIPPLLKASHIKPWRDCASDAERLDVFNGLLLAPHLDAAFDRGFVTFGEDGSLIVSKSLGHEGLRMLGIEATSKCAGLTDAHQKYLVWHRTNEFQGK